MRPELCELVKLLAEIEVKKYLEEVKESEREGRLPSVSDNYTQVLKGNALDARRHLRTLQ